MKNIYFMIGAPGVGKTTFIKEASQKIFGDERLQHHVIGPDNLRLMVECPVAKPNGRYGISSTNEKYVWSIIHDILEKKADKGELIIVDATHSRNTAISAYKKYSDQGYRVTAIDFSDYASIDEILKRNSSRESHKFVPEEVIRTIQARVETLDIPTWVKVIKPDEFVEEFTDIKYNFDQFNSLTFIGDIHGCSRELQRLLDAHALTIQGEPNKKDALVFVGDYFDRGYDVVGTFKMLQALKEHYWVLFLMGNHEEPLKYYREFMQVMTNATHQWIDEALVSLEEAAKAEQDIKDAMQALDDLEKSWRSKIFGLSTYKTAVLENDIVMAVARLRQHAIDYEPEALVFMREFRSTSYKNLDAFIENIKVYPTTIHKFTEMVNKFKIPNSLVKDEKYHFHKMKRTSVGTAKKFLLSDIKYTEITSFVKGCAQMFYGDFHGQTVLATHGGLVNTPTKATPTADMVRGVGAYHDALLVDETFHKNHPDVLSVHGHRNMTNLPIQTTDGTFNINGDVDLGLRAIQFHKDKTVETTEIMPNQETMDFFREAQLKKAKKFNAKKLSVQEEGLGLMRLFQDHTHIDVKKLPKNVAAINFTRKAFEKGVWDHLTIKARGLFASVDTHENPAGPNEINIIARGYEKFFNIGERHGFEQRDIRDLAYPIHAYEKANGYLGILSVDSRDPKNPEWFIASKTTTEGDFAANFRKLITPSLTPELMQMVQDAKVTLVFEVIDPVFDPHIEEYKEAELVLLDAVQNQIFFTKLNTEEVNEFVKVLKTPDNLFARIRTKKYLKTCENFNDYYTLVESLNNTPFLSRDGIEGVVFEDSSTPENMFKLKTDWYSFWKYMRTVKDKIANRVRKSSKKSGSTALTKSDAIKLKAALHNESHIKVFNFMASLAEKDFDAYQKMSIIDVRNAMHEAGEA